MSESVESDYDGGIFMLSDAWVTRRRPQPAILITAEDIVEMTRKNECDRFTPTARASLGKVPENGYVPARVLKDPRGDRRVH